MSKHGGKKHAGGKHVRTSTSVTQVRPKEAGALLKATGLGWARLRGGSAPAALVVLLWPFLFHMSLIGVGGVFAPIGNDFTVLYYVYKPYLLANLLHGHVPMWMPQEAAGFAFAANPFTQALYPGNLLIAPLAWLKDDWTMVDEQRYAVGAISMLALALFGILRRVGHGRMVSAVVAAAVASSYKVTELLRFPNAIHALACAGLSYYAVVCLRSAQTRRALVGWTFALAAAVFSVATAGYPYDLVYMVIGLPALAMWLEFAAPEGFATRRRPFRSYATAAGAGLAGGIGAAAPYLLAVQRLLSQTTDRGGGDWQYATAGAFGWRDYLGSLLLPTTASWEGWFYFGSAGICLLVLGIVAAFQDVRDRQSWRGLAVYAAWISWIAFFGLSASNPLFRIVWTYVPGISALREWGRINVLFLFPLAFGFASALAALHRRLVSSNDMRQPTRRFLLLALGTAAICLIGQFSVIAVWGSQSSFTVSQSPYYRVPEASTYVLGTVLLLVLLLAGLAATQNSDRRARLRMHDMRVRVFLTAMTLLWAAQLHDLRLDSWMWVRSEMASNATATMAVPMRDASALKAYAAAALESNRRPPSESPMFHPRPPWATATYANWHYERYVAFLSDSTLTQASRDLLLGISAKSRFFFARADGQDQTLVPSDVVVSEYNGTILRLQVRAPAEGSLVFADNWDPGWMATVDGKRVNIERFGGTFKAVQVHKGVSEVAMGYCPFSGPPYSWLCAPL